MKRNKWFRGGVATLTLASILACGWVQASETGLIAEARQLIKNKDYKSAIKVLDQAKGAGQDTVEINLLLSEALSGRINQVGMIKKMSLAKKIKKNLEHTLELDPKNLDAMDGLVQFHLLAPSSVGGDKDEARILVDKIIKIDAMRGYLLGAQMAHSMKNANGARDYLEKAHALSPENIDVLLGMSSLEAEGKNYQKAIEILDNCLGHEAGNVQCQYLIGKFADIGNVQIDKGIKALQSVIKTGVENKSWLAYTHFRLGNLLTRKGDTSEARKHYQVAIKIDDVKPAKEALKKLVE